MTGIDAIRTGLLAWLDNCESGIAPSALADDDEQDILYDARNYESGLYERTDEDQKERARAAIMRYCDSLAEQAEGIEDEANEDDGAA